VTPLSRPVPPIPPILSDELIEAVSSLVRAAHSYRSVLFLVAQDNPKAMDVMMKHEDLLHVCDRVINGWRKQLGHDVEDEKGSP
jgi:hypothetical protein